MLHPAPDSTQRARLLEVVEMQRQLIEVLCALPPGSSVNRTWLATVWPHVADERWLDQFWDNDKDRQTKVGARAKWCNDIAVATLVEKQTIKGALAEQIRFKELYDEPPNVRREQLAGVVLYQTLLQEHWDWLSQRRRIEVLQ
jgi:hypothetical protein